jgi:hypothetical protein
VVVAVLVVVVAKSLLILVNDMDFPLANQGVYLHSYIYQCPCTSLAVVADSFVFGTCGMLQDMKKESSTGNRYHPSADLRF